MKTAQEARENFDAATGSMPDRYKKGIARADWRGPAGSDEAETNYAEGTQAAVAAKSRQRGVNAVTNEDWRDKSIRDGGAVIGTRTKDSLDKWMQKWGPMYEQVQNRVAGLPARTRDFRTNIANRLTPTVEAWKQASGKE